MKTALGRRLMEIRQRIVASGVPLRGWDDINNEKPAALFSHPLAFLRAWMESLQTKRPGADTPSQVTK